MMYNASRRERRQQMPPTPLDSTYSCSLRRSSISFTIRRIATNSPANSPKLRFFFIGLLLEKLNKACQIAGLEQKLTPTCRACQFDRHLQNIHKPSHYNNLHSIFQSIIDKISNIFNGFGGVSYGTH